MPTRSTAIQLNKFTVNTISTHFDLPEKDVLAELYWADANNVTYYYIKDVIYMGKIYKYLLFNEDEFEESFALKPKGIEDHLVSVLQVR